jgi:hypothetical protein
MEHESFKLKKKDNKASFNYKSLKSFYCKNGMQLNAEGLKASKKIEKVIRKTYSEWLDEGFSPSECREMLLMQVWHTTTFVNAMRS